MAGRSISNWAIPPLPPRLLDDIPQKLEVTDAGTALNAITHSSYYGHPANPNSLEPGPSATDYDKLEHLGVPVIITMIMNKLYPWLKPGPCTVLRNQISSNSVLSQISSRLGLPKQLRAHPSQLAHLRDNTSIQAALFQAHIGALAITDHKTIGINSALASYLEKIFHPIITWGFITMKEYHQGLVGIMRTASQAGRRAPPSHDEIDRVALGAKNTLDAFFDVASRGTCKFVTEETQPPFQAKCEVVLANGDKFSTGATRTKKKMAFAAAAWEMCGELLLPREEVGE